MRTLGEHLESRGVAWAATPPRVDTGDQKMIVPVHVSIDPRPVGSLAVPLRFLHCRHFRLQAIRPLSAEIDWSPTAQITADIIDFSVHVWVTPPQVNLVVTGESGTQYAYVPGRAELIVRIDNLEQYELLERLPDFRPR